ncbi:MAG: lipoyl(octanoyl) transferase LipB [Proteobacteria bacterium]|nr:lipoyl(octanoyl) transferase LipB [Pseudomonadota bacterium]
MTNRRTMAAIEWKIATDPVPYPEAVEAMERRVAAIRMGEGREMAWLLEHPPIFTAGASARKEELINAGAFPVYATGRGGRHTYHGPGQRVVYVMLDIRRRDPDIGAYVRNLEEWLIRTLARFGLNAERRQGRIGIWVVRRIGAAPAGLRHAAAATARLGEASLRRSQAAQAGECKIAAIGVRVRQGVSYHGVSINVDPDLDHYAGIVPCGIKDFGVTSLADLGIGATMAEVDEALKACFEEVFGVETVVV